MYLKLSSKLLFEIKNVEFSHCDDIRKFEYVKKHFRFFFHLALVSIEVLEANGCSYASK